MIDRTPIRSRSCRVNTCTVRATWSEGSGATDAVTTTVSETAGGVAGDCGGAAGVCGPAGSESERSTALTVALNIAA